ncbi:MAG TPA: carbamoyl-phosphate synthase large subunit [Chthoniobacterales bacterium]|jgi:carbamoylphosphate synthase large subunit/REP element-mobilizing transposase RayT|nr:carbamoyl-phosphate synthase large subunit [Chthoniobacterales bacterium]
MPRNNELHKILLIGSGPIVIGQGCEFDYSGVQACKALREEGFEVVLVNSNPATIMTDPEFADRTYIEPITPEVVEAILAREKPDAILPTMGGQTALNVAMELNRNGALVRHQVKLIGANAQAIAKGEDRQLFKEAMLRIGLDVPRSGIAHSVADAIRIAGTIDKFPLIIRPAFTLGGSGGGIAYNRDELEEIVGRGLALSPVTEVLIEESLVGWKEFEMEVMRDCADNCVVVCAIENFDAMGVHTGDSITVAPAQTLTDKEYQMMRDASFDVIREIGVETGGSNIQFAVNPENGRMVVIEMNPRVSRSSALASKATGFPIAKIAAKLAVGYTLDEIRNDITRETPASFEPTIDYCVVKIPRFTFEKFPQADPTLTTQMKSVGEAMAIGRTFKEALQKALRSLEIKRFGLCGDGNDKRVDADTLRLKLAIPNAERVFHLAQAFQDGMSIEEVFELTKIDRWFLHNVRHIVEEQRRLGFQPDSADRLPACPSNLFQPFDSQTDIHQTQRHLPHWEQPGATYFVTFRLIDSVAQDVLAHWREERDQWLNRHPRPWDWRTEREYMRLNEESRETWLDQGHGSCLLRQPAVAGTVASTLKHFDRERYVLDAFVVMPNHVHILFKPLSGNSLSSILHSWKSFSANAINRQVNHDGPVWMAENFDTIVRDTAHLAACREYIARNPVKAGLSPDEFVLELRAVLQTDEEGEQQQAGSLSAESGWKPDLRQLRRLKKLGFSDRQLATTRGVPESEVRAERKAAGVTPTYRLVDTCAAEFEAYTPYYYSTYGTENEMRRTDRPKIMILGGGPNRIGQGIEFDYCCVHAAFALREIGFETIMVNSNPETVSTDYDTSDKLYFEPLTHEDVLNIYEQERPEGVIVQFGGQTPLNLAEGLKAAGVPIIGTQPESIEMAEDRKLFAAMLDKLGLRQTPSGSAVSADEAIAIAERIGYPVLVRPSFVLGGRAMELVYHGDDLRRYMQSAIEVSPERPVLVDRFLEDAMEVDVDCIADGEISVIGAIMEHIEQAGIHSGDSACVIPTFSLPENVLEQIRSATKAMARELKVRGLMNVQFAVKGDEVYVLEVNPRASRTVPFVSKAIGVPLAKLAAKVMTGKTLTELGFTEEIVPKHFAVKEAVFPFLRYQGVDIALGPEMKSTGEVMGIDADLGLAYAKSQMAAPPPLPKSGRVFISVKDSDKAGVIPVAREFVDLGFEIISTSGTWSALHAAGVPVTKVHKIREGRPHVLDLVTNRDIDFIINSPSGKIPREDEVRIRNTSLAQKIPIMTTIRAAQASANGIRSLQRGQVQVKTLQEYHGRRRPNDE